MRLPSGPKTGLETLERYVRTVRYAPLLALGIFFLVNIILVVTLSQTMAQNELLLLVGILVGAGLLVALILRVTFSKLLVGVKRAIDLLRTQSPRRMFVRFTGVMTLNGSVVKLWDADAEELSPGLMLASVRTVSKKQGSVKEAVPVDVYFSPTSDREMVFEVPQDYRGGRKRAIRGLSAGNVFWGRLCDRRQLEDSWRKMRLFLLGVLLFSVCFVGFLAWLSQRSLDSARQDLALGQESLSWPKAPGVILDSRVAKVTIKRGKSRVPGFEARIRYEYTVGGGTYSCNRIFFGYAAGRKQSFHEKIIAPYPRGNTVEIRYNPRDPAMAVLEPGHVDWNRREVEEAERAMWIALSMSSLIFIMPVVMFVLMKRRRSMLQEELRQAMGLGGMGNMGSGRR